MMLLVGALVCTSACTLTFDTDSVPFESQTPDTSDPPQDTPPPQDTAPNNAVDVIPDDVDDDPPPVREALGRLCGINNVEFCFPENDDFDECARQPCASLGDGAECMRSLLGNFGYCSAPCRSDDDCVGPPENDFASTMRCVKTQGNEEGYCLPGSQQPCFTTRQCPDDESCQIALTPGDGPRELTTGIVCQTKQPRTADGGQFCNDDPRRSSQGTIQRCANDICFDDYCAELCDLDAPDPDEICGNPNLICADALDLAPLGLCTPRPCVNNTQCSTFEGHEPFCAVTEGRESFEDGPLTGRCRLDNPDSNGSLELGQSCNDVDDNTSGSPRLCASRQCTGSNPSFQCTALCDSNEDCADNQICAVDRIRDGVGPSYVKQCVYALGSRARCDNDPDACVGNEVCAPFLFGEPSEDRTQVSQARAEGLCVVPIPAAADIYADCSELACSTPGACFNINGGGTLCTSVCDPTALIPNCESPGEFEFPACQEVNVLRAENSVEGISQSLGFCVF